MKTTHCMLYVYAQLDVDLAADRSAAASRTALRIVAVHTAGDDVLLCYQSAHLAHHAMPRSEANDRK
ncbi:unnamed protein product [Ceratitis capitata]|uniref:(Mediterranean fruit fly) hypothetical protein n=1 Tax=Ceratitis capitata TaxID=7213 RepID=A0A811VGM4_CERCA|nr:unnamed protein product [Ceratitis capitata]